MTDAKFWEQEFREVEAINARHLGVNVADLREDEAAWCPECDGDLYLPRGASIWQQPTAYCLKCRTMWETEADEAYNSETCEEIHFFRAVKKLPTPIEKQMQELRWASMGDDL